MGYPDTLSSPIILIKPFYFFYLNGPKILSKGEINKKSDFFRSFWELKFHIIFLENFNAS